MIDNALLTLPEMMQAHGYATAGFGKWHLGTQFPTLDGEKPAGFGQFRADDNGANLDLQQPVRDGPLDHGFAQWYGFSCASETWILDGNAITGAIGHDLYTIEATPNQEQIQVIPLEEYLPHITDKSIDFLKTHQASSEKQPFFLYFAPYVPHIPLAVHPDYRGRTEAGLYGDYVLELDQYVGQLIETLDSLDLTDNTIVVFASDNGSQFEFTSRELDMTKASNSPSDRLAIRDSTQAHRPNWPLRGTKWSIYEGGVRTPLIARWPGHFPAGASSDQLIGLNDLMATFAAVLEYSDMPDQVWDSHNLLAAFLGKTEEKIRHEILVQSSKGEFGIIAGKWKYIPPSNKQEQRLGELYDLDSDPSEQHSRLQEHPELTQRLQLRLDSLIQTMGK